MLVYTVRVRRDANTITPISVPEYEIPILQEMFGEENVQTAAGLSIEEHGLGEPTGEIADPQDEVQRLERKYGPEMIEGVYGKRATKGLEKSVESARKKSAGKKKAATE